MRKRKIDPHLLRIANIGVLTCTFTQFPAILKLVWVFFRMPDRLNLSPCFVDYLNFRCCDAQVMENLLQRPINFAINQTDAFAQILVMVTTDLNCGQVCYFNCPKLSGCQLCQLIQKSN